MAGQRFCKVEMPNHVVAIIIAEASTPTHKGG